MRASASPAPSGEALSTRYSSSSTPALCSSSERAAAAASSAPLYTTIHALTRVFFIRHPSVRAETARHIYQYYSIHERVRKH